MKTNRFYLYGTLACVILFIAFTVISIPLIVKSISLPLIDNEIKALEREVNQISGLASTRISDQASKDAVKDIIQDWIENSQSDMHYVSIIDWSGKIINYPEAKRINSVMDSEQNQSSFKNSISAEVLYNHAINDDSQGSEIAYMTPVSNSDWIIIGHFNIDKLHLLIASWKRNLYVFFSFLGLSILLFVLIMIRRISSFYDGQLSDKLFNLKDEVINLSKLNASLAQYQQNLVVNTSTTEVPNDKKDLSKKRILTYVRNELLPVFTDDIAYIYVDNTITYIVRKDGKRSTSNESLDLIYSYLDERSFFRVNRQVIVAISAIDTITKFGNSKLNIQVSPPSEIDIVIGKNKAAAFKQWLDL
ncbi:MAG: LytTR family DNA-binding domain-containing protein [Bacteroidota bacterium]